VLSPGPQQHPEGDTVTLAIGATDPDGDALTYSAAGLPDGLAIDPATGVISGTLSAASAGSHAVTVGVTDGALIAQTSFTWQVAPLVTNQAPVCSAARPSTPIIWPPNHRTVYPIEVLGVTDPDGDGVRITITAILQDEPTNTRGDGDTAIDGFGVGTSIAGVRGERAGTPRVPGDGRIYEIQFTADDTAGATCSGTVLVGVPHDRGNGKEPVDSGVRYDSTVPTGGRIR
jgi:hypothetical protein